MNARIYDIVCSTAKIEVITDFGTDVYEVCYWPQDGAVCGQSPRSIRWVKPLDPIHALAYFPDCTDTFHGPIAPLLPLFNILCALNEYKFESCT